MEKHEPNIGLIQAIGYIAGLCTDERQKEGIDAIRKFMMNFDEKQWSEKNDSVSIKEYLAPYVPKDPASSGKIYAEITVTDEDIDDIMVSALEGGITYWCDSALPEGGTYLGECASEQISRGGNLIIHDMEDDKDLVLDRKKFLKGLQGYLKHNCQYRESVIVDDRQFVLDVGLIDAWAADCIIQRALFDDIVYG